ncbi:hypothetical protein F4860DRAFT_518426 [Xylaria cubensis]|nr:hypothetical protein F4860DRAFT_518426 [Xylaria cubensis]
MSTNTHRSDEKSVPSLDADGQSARRSPGGRTSIVPNMSDTEFREFRQIYEMQLLPALTEVLGLENIGGQVHLHKRKSILIVTPEEAPSSLKQQIEWVVAEKLHENLRAKISVEFALGQVTRAAG